MNATQSVYLAGPIAGATYGNANNWRDFALDALWRRGVRALSPLRDITPLDDDLSGPVAARYMASPLTSAAAITARDRNDIARCDAVLVNLLGAPRVSIGTMIELGWADAYRKPIVLCMEATGSLHEHEMVRALSPFVTDDLDQAVRLVLSVLGV